MWDVAEVNHCDDFPVSRRSMIVLITIHKRFNIGNARSLGRPVIGDNASFKCGYCKFFRKSIHPHPLDSPGLLKTKSL